MTVINTCLVVAADGAISAAVPLPMGEHVAAITLGRRSNLKRMVERLRAVPAPSEIETREPIELPDRDW